MPAPQELQKYPRLFEPARIGELTLRNRTMMAPMESNLANLDGTVSETMLQYYQARAAGGVGMVIVEYTCVDRPQGNGGSPPLAPGRDPLVAGHPGPAEAIHQGGAKTLG